MTDVVIGKIGKILSGREAGWFVKIEYSSPGTDSFLVLISKSLDFQDIGFDDWVENETALAEYIREAGWLVEWME